MPPERWLELKVRSTLEAEWVASALLELGGSAVEESEGEYITFLLPPADLESLLDLARERLRELSPDTPFHLEWRWQPQQDWEVLWRRGLGPRRVTPRLTVTPSWDPVHPEPGELVLVLDPGMAFGTAEHATTRGCLRLLDGRVTSGSRVADVGAGSGILSIAAAHLGAVEVLALETDGMACETALENVLRNGVGDRVQVLEALVTAGPPLPGTPLNGIVANLQSHLLLPLLSTFRASLTPEGWLIVSGVLLEERDRMMAAASRAGFAFSEGDEEDGWWAGAFFLSAVPG